MSSQINGCSAHKDTDASLLSPDVSHIKRRHPWGLAHAIPGSSATPNCYLLKDHESPKPSPVSALLRRFIVCPYNEIKVRHLYRRACDCLSSSHRAVRLYTRTIDLGMRMLCQEEECVDRELIKEIVKQTRRRRVVCYFHLHMMEKVESEVQEFDYILPLPVPHCYVFQYYLAKQGKIPLSCHEVFAQMGPIAPTMFRRAEMLQQDRKKKITWEEWYYPTDVDPDRPYDTYRCNC